MSKVVKRRWQNDIASGLPRKDRASCDYEAYIPDSLVGRPVTLDGDVAADVADAERAIGQFDTRATALVDTEALARLLLRAESVASSKIEGLEVGGRRLLRAEAARSLGEESDDVTAIEVLNNIQAMQWALGEVGVGDDITVEILLEAHRRLLAGTRIEEYGGEVREEQNWIGGSSYNPCSAAFVPPPHEHVKDLLDDLCAFSNSDDLPAVVQAAMAHAQFETIHPFVDGNGRIGRVLIHLILRRRDLTPHVLPPISLILATWSDDYVSGLTAIYRLSEVGDCDCGNESLDCALCHCKPSRNRRCVRVRRTSDVGARCVAQEAWPRSIRIGCRPVDPCAARSTDRDGQRRSRLDWSYLSSHESSSDETRRVGHPRASQRRST
jgi:fido (protein-threonine AMPylation protein)